MFPLYSPENIRKPEATSKSSPSKILPLLIVCKYLSQSNYLRSILESLQKYFNGHCIIDK